MIKYSILGSSRILTTKFAGWVPLGNNKGQNGAEAYSTSPEPDPYEIWDLEFSRSWEAEEQGVTIQQIVDVQGRLKECIGFWTEVL